MMINAYRIQLTATSLKPTTGWKGSTEAHAFFSTAAEPGSTEFNSVLSGEIERIVGQQSRWWAGHTVGKLFVRDGARGADVMTPEWDFHRGSMLPVWKEIGE